MLENIVNLVGVNFLFMVGLLMATCVTPAAYVIKVGRPIIGSLLFYLGLIGQVLFGMVVTGCLMSDTIWEMILGVPR